MQLLDLYNQKKLIKFFKVFQIIISNKINNKLTYILLKLLFFAQILTYSLVNTPAYQEDNDIPIKILKGIRNITLPHLLIKKETNYIVVFVFIAIFTLLIIICYIFIYCYTFSKFNKKSIKVVIFNIIGIFFYNYLQCPILNILLYSIACDEGKHIYLNSTKCYSNKKHFLLLIFSLITLLILLIHSIVLSIFNYDIGTIDENDCLSRINCNFELYENICMIMFYIYGFFLRIYLPSNKISRIIYKSFLIIISSGCFIYGQKYLYYYNNIFNLITIIGWLFVNWFVIILVIKEVFDIENSVLFVVIGWILLLCCYYILDKRREEKTYLGIQILDTNNIKNIETLIYFLLNLTKTQNNNSIILKGIMNTFEECFNDDPELNEKSNKFLSNLHLQKQLGGINNFHFHIYNIIFLLYDTFLDKTLLKNDIMLIMCYFLINKLNNFTYAISLCSQIKVNGLKLKYLKFLLMEKIKIHQCNNLTSKLKDPISKIEIGRVIMYYNYSNNLKIKIYDAVSAQIDYFDNLKNSQISNSITTNFLNTGEKILNIRKEILSLWEKINQLYPFCEENKLDYLLYLNKILKDKEMAEKEEEKYNNLKKERLVYKNSFYYSLFNPKILSILLVDGHQLRGKILYTTPNFGLIFNYTPKELMTAFIYNFQPSIVSNFHKDIVDETIKYSNLTSIFKDRKKMIMKERNGGICKILAYIKCIPNLSYGLMYIMTIEKIQEKTFIIVLDNNFHINEISPEFSINSENELNTYNGSNLLNNLKGHHIGIIIPEILKELEYKEKKFIFSKCNIELGGKFYPNINDFEETENNIKVILDKIKTTGKLMTEAEELEFKSQEVKNKLSTSIIPFRKRKSCIEINNKEYKEFIMKLNVIFEGRIHKIFYSIKERIFLNGKYRYFILYITKEVFITKDNFQKINSKSTTLREEKVNENMISNNKIKGIQMKISNNEEKKNLIKKENDDKKNKNNIDKTNNSIKSSSSMSDISIINDLKNQIITKSESFLTIYIKIILSIFSIVSIILIILDCLGLNNKFVNLNNFLEQNLFFNQTKLSCCCYYIASSDIKNYLLGILWFCDTWDCKTFYTNYIFYCHEHMKNFINTDIYYNDEFKNTLQKRFIHTLSAYKMEKQFNTSMNTLNILNTLVSSSLYIHYNLVNEDFQIKNETLSLAENIVNLSYKYLKNKELKGYNVKERRNKAKKPQYKGTKLYLFVNLIIFSVTVILMIYFVMKMYKYENYFLEKLIKFQNSKFEEYLKYLQDLKKKLRNDTGEEEEQNNDESHKISIDEENESENHKTLKNRNNGKTNKNENEKQSKNSKRKISKFQQEKNDKLIVMSNFFLKFNLIFIIEIIIILLIFLSYYLFVELIYIGKRNDFLSFDDLENTLLGIFLRINEVYTQFQYVLVNYLYWKRIKNLIKQDLENGKTKIYAEGRIFSSFDDLNSYTYDIEIPDVTFNKIGNLMIPITSNIIIDKIDIKKQSSEKQLKELYNGNICNILYNDTNKLYNECKYWWSGILLQGLEATIIEFSLKITELQNYYKDWKNGITTAEEVYNSDLFFDLEYFIIFFFSDAFYKTIELMSDLRIQKIKVIENLFELTLVWYICLILLLNLLLVLLIYRFKKFFNKFLNFIGIIPIEYLYENQDFYKDILKLGKDIY